MYPYHKRWIVDPAPLPTAELHPTADISPAELRLILTPEAGHTPRRYVAAPTTGRELAYPVGHTITLRVNGKPAATATISHTRTYKLNTRIYLIAPIATAPVTPRRHYTRRHQP